MPLPVSLLVGAGGGAQAITNDICLLMEVLIGLLLVAFSEVWKKKLGLILKSW